MYCPKCGQQVSDHMRFCSRCGLPISEVADWLAGGGTLAVREEAQVAVLSPRRKGMRRGAKMMFWGGILMPIFLGLSIAADAPLICLPFIIILAGLLSLLYSRIFGEEVPSHRDKQAQDVRLGTMLGHSALPPASDSGLSSSSSRRQVRTTELAQPPSVTEQTTKLLDSQ